MAKREWTAMDEEAEKQGNAMSQFGHGRLGMGVKKQNLRFTKRIPQCMAYNDVNCNKFLK